MALVNQYQPLTYKISSINRTVTRLRQYGHPTLVRVDRRLIHEPQTTTGAPAVPDGARLLRDEQA